MKAILVPTGAHELMESVLETALLAARRFDAYVEGFAIRPLITEYVPVDMVGGLTWTRDDITDEQAIRQSREIFDRFMTGRSIPRFEGREARLGYGWLENAAAGDTFVSSQARVFDMTVLGRPDRKSTRLNSSHANISYAVFCLKKKMLHQSFRQSIKAG